MINSKIRTQFNLFLSQLSNQVGEDGFLEFASTQYKKIMSFQHIHFIHLTRNGDMFLEEINGDYDIDTFLSYKDEDVWIPENYDTPLPKIINQRIDKKTCQLYADNTNLYNWLLFNQKCNDAYGTIHPCLTAFICLRLGENQLENEEFQFHLSSSKKIMDLYYLDRRLQKSILIEEVFSEQRQNMLKYPLLILDKNFEVLFDENKFKSELKGLNIDYKNILFKIKNTILFSTPYIDEYKETYEFMEYNRDKFITFHIQTIIKEKNIIYLCYLKVSSTQKTNFTKREIEIINLIDRGLSNRKIADILFISVETVKKHIYNMMIKSNVKNRISLIKHFNIQQN